MFIDIDLINGNYSKSVINIIENKINLEYDNFKGIDKFNKNINFLLKLKEKLNLMNTNQIDYQLYNFIIDKLDFILNE